MTLSVWDAPAACLRARLLDLDPDLGTELDEARRAAAQAVTVAIEDLVTGPWDADRAAAPPGRLGLLVVDGILLRSHSIGKVISAELLGAGDVIQPSISGHEFSLVEARSSWEVLAPARVAILDMAFLHAAALRWPELLVALFGRTVHRARFIAFQLALAHVRRVDDRLLLLFWHLAERWGRVTCEGVVVPLRLKHAVLGMLVGAQRPTVTTALKHLSEAGTLQRRSGDTWLLTGDPPDATDLETRTLPPAGELSPV
jgi:CRP/FNR family cyclic AMP-dependent transcriptional regulator